MITNKADSPSRWTLTNASLIAQVLFVFLIILSSRPALSRCFCNNGNGYISGIPKIVEQADQDFDARKERIVRIVIREYGLSDFSSTNYLKPYARIAAGLTAIKEGYNVGEDDDFTQIVEDWTSDIDRGIQDPGTWATNSDDRGNLDFHMIRLISILYLFKDDRHLLTDRSCQNIISEIFKKYVGQEIWELYGLGGEGHGAAHNPETENHVLMTLSSIYLINQWIHENYREFSEDTWKDVLGSAKWNRLSREDRYNNFDNNGKKMEDTIFAAVGRILHNGYFETNATAYQSKSVGALLNLYSFSKSKRMRTAALNALNYTTAKFSFQSFEGYRWPPKRRTHEYAIRGMYVGDGLIKMMAALSGICNWENSCPKIPDQSCTNYEGGPLELFTILLKYKLPPAIHDFMLNKHMGYWARMQARYDQDHYRYGQPAKYFYIDESVILNEEEMESVPEFYFVTNQFMNCSGGSFNRLRGSDSDRPKYYDFLARPHVLFTRGGSGEVYDGPDKDKNDPYKENTDGPISENFMYMLGESDRFWKSRNSGTYKSFSYGYQTSGGHSYPMKIPQDWDRYQYKIGSQNEFSYNPEDRVRFRFYDLSHVPRYSFYIVAARVSKDLDDPQYRDISRGFWEIVPRKRYASIENLVEYVLNNNCCGAFSNEAYRNYRYKMTTGETVELAENHGGTFNSEPIVAVTGPNGEALDIATHTYALNREAIARMPLMEVREVDRNYRFTGRIFAYARGDGRLEIFNPFVGQTVIANSSDYRNPRSEYRQVRRTCGSCFPRSD